MNKQLLIYSTIALLAGGTMGAIGAYSKLTSDQNTQNQNQNYQMMPNKPNHMMGNKSDHMMGNKSDHMMGNKSDHMMGNKSDHMMNDEHHQMMNDEHHQMTNNVQAKLTEIKPIEPEKNTKLTIKIEDKNGNPVTKFDTFQEKLMHLIVVSNDLKSFDHLHPSYQDNGIFTITTKFPQPGDYTLFSDYKPTGSSEQVSVLSQKVLGTATVKSMPNFQNTKKIGKIDARLILDRTEVKAGTNIKVTFELKDSSSQQLITNLQPYLGEQGHLVIIKQSSPLTRRDYIHAHAMSNASPGQVEFMTKFPTPGNYKLWGQFNRNGEIITVDFWVNVI